MLARKDNNEPNRKDIVTIFLLQIMLYCASVYFDDNGSFLSSWDFETFSSSGSDSSRSSGGSSNGGSIIGNYVQNTQAHLNEQPQTGNLHSNFSPWGTSVANSSASYSPQNSLPASDGSSGQWGAHSGPLYTGSTDSGSSINSSLARSEASMDLKQYADPTYTPKSASCNFPTTNVGREEPLPASKSDNFFNAKWISKNSKKSF